MRKMLAVCLLAATAVGSSGCVMVIGVKEPLCREQVVAVDGKFYVVNMKSHKARKIQVEPMEDSTTIHTEESENN